MMWEDNDRKRLRAIDLDLVWATTPLVDLSRYVNTAGLNYRQTKRFIKSYLKHSGLPHKRKNVIDLMMDRELYMPFDLVEGLIWKVAQFAPQYINDPKNLDQKLGVPKYLESYKKRWEEAGSSRRSTKTL